MKITSLKFLFLIVALCRLTAHSVVAFTNDNKPDLMWQHENGACAFWYFPPPPNNTLIAQGNTISPSDGPEWKMVGRGDFDRDGIIDILWRDSINGSNKVWFMNADRTIRERLPVTTLEASLGWRVGAVADFDLDGFLDIVWRNYSTGQNVIWYLNGPKGIDLKNGLGIDVHQMDFNWKIVGAASFNPPDKKPQILWFNTLTGQMALWYMKSNPGQSWNNILDTTGWIKDASGIILPVPDRDLRVVGTMDFNGDGQVDILFRNTTIGQNAVWYLNTNTVTGGAYLTRLDDTAWRACGQDLDFSTWRIDGDPSVILRSEGLSYNVLTAVAIPHANNQTGQIALKRRDDPRLFTIQRRLTTDSTWTTVTSGTTNSTFQDPASLDITKRYEYRVFPSTVDPKDQNDPHLDYKVRGVTAGIRLPPGDNLQSNEFRGAISLIVDPTFASQLVPEINTLVEDLVGDGWKVLLNNTTPDLLHDDVTWLNNTGKIATIRTIIQNDFSLRGAKAALLIGHLAIPYSGTTTLDNHANHHGAWPSDCYYGEAESNTWTDNSVDVTSSQEANRNRSGDKKWDQDYIETPLEVPVGRIDFSRMSVFTPKTEVDLTRQYLHKNHAFRHKLLTFPQSAITLGYFGSFNQLPPNEYPIKQGEIPLIQNSLRLGSRFFGFDQTQILVGDLFNRKSSHLCGFLAGPGGFDRVNDPTAGTYNGFSYLHDAGWLNDPSQEPSIGFYFLLGSYMGDWNVQNNFLRAVLATPNSGLAAFWAVHDWQFGELALGDPLSSGLKRTIDSAGPRSKNRQRTMSILGDPTLRLHQTAPVSGLRRVNDHLEWSAGEPGCHYFVYKSDTGNLSGHFARQTPDPLATLTFQAGPGYYQVRALKLITSGSGAYTNLSQGKFTN